MAAQDPQIARRTDRRLREVGDRILIRETLNGILRRAVAQARDHRSRSN